MSYSIQYINFRSILHFSFFIIQRSAASSSDAWGIEALSVSHKATALLRLEICWGLGGGFVDAVPKARPEYFEGHAQILKMRNEKWKMKNVPITISGVQFTIGIPWICKWVFICFKRKGGCLYLVGPDPLRFRLWVSCSEKLITHCLLLAAYR